MPDINRVDAAVLLARGDVNEIVEEARAASAALSTFRIINMPAASLRMPVLSALPTAGFVTEDAGASGVKPTTEVVWANKELVAEEIAVIVPIHENVFDDASYNIWDSVRPLIAEEFGRILDGAVFFGGGVVGAPAKPASWPLGLEPGARAAGNVVSGAAVVGDLAEDINQTWALVEADGYDVNVNYTARTLRARLRGLRDSQNAPIYLDNLRGDGAAASIYGQDIFYVRNGAWRAASADADAATVGNQPAGADLIAGDRTKAVLGIRSDMQFKLLDQATVGGLNLAERDMIALRVKMRVGFQVASSTTREGGATAYPFAVLGA